MSDTEPDVMHRILVELLVLNQKMDRAVKALEGLRAAAE